jgi:hypothetical protein
LSGNQGHVDVQLYFACCLEHGNGISIDSVEAARYFKLSADGNCPIGALKWADCLEHGKGVGADACEAGRYYKKFVECVDHIKEYRWDGFVGTMVCDRKTFEVSSRAESIAALFGHASEHWKSCVTGG